jgi:hypothetical protein
MENASGLKFEPAEELCCPGCGGHELVRFCSDGASPSYFCCNRYCEWLGSVEPYNDPDYARARRLRQEYGRLEGAEK